ncbi:hypothetical protein HBO08_02700 [Pseudomonas rhodesiae]|uniref:hypothetical protein n=1 Tax=Pseudomonas rhodesiae TaxID=76760 RepID=UPI00147403FD|nr:hypothetical protein [Pseudomonas rhodesiae]NMZ15928.1 hypothetical protein [Pseudomonas rhodesiae]
MSKKTEDRTSTVHADPYYLKDSFVNFAKPTYLQKKQTQKIIKSEFRCVVTYTKDHTELDNNGDHNFFDERLSWYESIETGSLKPSIDEAGHVRLRANSPRNSQHEQWCEQIETIATQWLDRKLYENTQSLDSESINSMLMALGQLTRYLPDLQQRQPNYFLDVATHKIGVTIQNEGTLTLLIGGNSEVEYSYAQRQEKGTVRISGIAKLTTNIRNSKNIWKLLNLQGIVK